MKKMILTAIAVLIIPISLFAEFPGTAKWKTIQTDHFNIHYPSSIEEAAKRLTVIAEEAHEFLSKKEKWETWSRVDVVLIDTTDLANGNSTPLPYNKIVLYLTNPQPHDSISNYDEWLKLLFIHEYTHSLNMDQINGLPVLTRFILGKAYNPNSWQPIYLLEGNAVLNESMYTGFGRLNSPYAEMIIRTEMTSDRIRTIADASNYPYSWPAGYVPYLYGAYFNAYLLKNYDKSFSEIMEANSNNCIPFLNSMNSHDVYNSSINNLWLDWIFYEREKYKLILKDIEKQKLTSYTLLTDSGRETGLPLLSQDGKYLYYFKNTGKNSSVINRINLDTQEETKIQKAYSPLSISENHGDIFFTDIKTYSNIYTFYDVNSPEENKKIKNTSKKRILYYDIKKETETMIKFSKGRYSLIVKNNGKDEIIISQSLKQLSYCKLSPNAEKIIFSLKDYNGDTELITYNIKSKKFTSLLKNSSNNIQPSWSSDSERIIFSSDKTGIYNAYELDLAAGTIKRLTNVTTGIFSPIISDDRTKLYFTVYGINGFNIAESNYPETHYSEETISVSNIDIKYFEDNPNRKKSDIKPKNYYSIMNLEPAIWSPWFSFYSAGEDSAGEDSVYNYFGGLIYGHDPLEFLTYTVGALYNSRLYNTSIFTSLIFSRYTPTLELNYSDDTLFVKDDGKWTRPSEDWEYFECQRSRDISLSLLYLKISNSYSFLLSATGQYSRKHNYNIFKDHIDLSKSNDSLANISMQFSNTKQYTYSVAPENGIILFASYTHKDTDYYSDNNNKTLLGGIDLFIPTFFGNTPIEFYIQNGVFINNNPTENYLLGRNDNYNPLKSNPMQLNMEGYNFEDEIHGEKIVLSGLYLHIPLIRKEWGFRTTPLYFKKLKLVPLLEAGTVNDKYKNIRYSDIYKAVGAELVTQFDLSYQIPLELYTKYCYGLDEQGSHSISFGLKGIIDIPVKSRFSKGHLQY